MKVLDRYIAGQFLFNAAALLCFLFALVFAIDFALNFDEYYEIAGALHAEASGFRKTLVSVGLAFHLWWPRLFQLFSYFLGLVLVGAVGFTCNQMMKHREFVAMLAGGLSLHRVARPILIATLGLVLLQAANREFMLPRLAPLLTRQKNDAGKTALGTTRQPLCADSRGNLLYATEVNLDEGAITGFYAWERSADGLMSRRVTADRALWNGASWTLENGRAESRVPGQPPRVAPAATFETDLSPVALRLRRFEGYADNLSTAQLTELVHSLRAEPNPPEGRIDKLERTRFGRIATLLGTFLLVILSFPFFLRREPTRPIIPSLIAAPLAIAAFMGLSIGATAAIPGLPPMLSVFVPVMVLIPLAIAAVTSVKT